MKLYPFGLTCILITMLMLGSTAAASTTAPATQLSNPENARLHPEATDFGTSLQQYDDQVDWIACVGSNREIRLVDPLTGREGQVTQNARMSWASAPAWSPDGARLVFGVGQYSDEDKGPIDLALVDLKTRTLSFVGLDYRNTPSIGGWPVVAIGSPAWAPDARSIIYSITNEGMGRYWNFRVVFLDSQFRKAGEAIPAISRGSYREGDLAFSPDSQWVSYALQLQGRPNLSEAELAENQGIWLARRSGESPQRVVEKYGRSAWSPNSNDLAYSTWSDEEGIHILDLGSKARRLLVSKGSWPTWSPDGSRIAYQIAAESTKPEIWIVNVNGTNAHKVGNCEHPAWRPFVGAPQPQPMPSQTTIPQTQTTIAFVANPAGSIWLMNTDGGSKVLLISSADAQGKIAWSPDGSQIAYVRDCQKQAGQSCYHIMITNLDGTARRELTPAIVAGKPALDEHVTWSRDGSRIAYSIAGKIYVISADGSNKRVITDGIMPSWSPDGAKIAYAKATKGIFIANADGSGSTRLTNGDELDPDWASDGKKIVYTSGAAVYVMNIDGSSITRVVGDGDNPRWSPDGKQIAFNRGGSDNGVYVVNADGSSIRRIADGAWPAWRPRPRPALTPEIINQKQKTIAFLSNPTLDVINLPTVRGPGYDEKQAAALLEEVRRAQEKNILDSSLASGFWRAKLQEDVLVSGMVELHIGPS